VGIESKKDSIEDVQNINLVGIESKRDSIAMGFSP
jgi:hypothetical protein